MVGVDERPRVVRHHRLQPGLVAGHALRLPPRPPASTTSSASSPTTSTRRRAPAGSTATASASAWRSPRGRFNLLVAAGGPRRREMRYRLFAHDRAGRPVTLAGVKNVEDGWFDDTWVDTTTLFTRLYTGWVARDEEDGATPLAAGVLHVSAGGFLALMLSMRGALRDKLRYGSFFTRSLLQVYVGRAHGHGLDRLPRPAPGLRALAGLRARAMARLPGAARACAGASWACAPRTGASSRCTTSAATREPTEGPVLLAARHRRAREPLLRLADAALDRRRPRGGRLRRLAGQLARLDRPARVRLHARRGGALRPSGADRRRPARDRGADAQGDRPLPGLDVLRPGLRRRAGARGDRRGLQRRVLPRRRPAAVQAADAGAAAACCPSAIPGFDPQWTLRPTALRARLLATWARTVRRECREPVCQMANYTYGVGGNILWDHANIDPPTHRWIAREFGWVPITFFRQMSRCAAAGHLVAASGYDEIPEDVVAVGAAQPAALDVPGGLGEPLLPRPQPGALVRLAGRPGARPARAGGGSGLHAPRRLLRPQRRARRVRRTSSRR